MFGPRIFWSTLGMPSGSQGPSLRAARVRMTFSPPMGSSRDAMDPMGLEGHFLSEMIHRCGFPIVTFCRVFSIENELSSKIGRHHLDDIDWYCMVLFPKRQTKSQSTIGLEVWTSNLSGDLRPLRNEICRNTWDHIFWEIPRSKRAMIPGIGWGQAQGTSQASAFTPASRKRIVTSLLWFCDASKRHVEL